MNPPLAIGTARFRSIYEAPRWAAVSSFLKDLAFELGVKIDLDVDKGWLSENGRFTVEGPKEDVLEFERRWNAAAKAYNE